MYCNHCDRGIARKGINQHTLGSRVQERYPKD